MSDSLWPHELQARLPCPSPKPGAHSNSCTLSWWCDSIISPSVVPFSSSLQSSPTSRSIQISQFFPSGGQTIRVSASTSVLQMNIQDWFPLGWTGWISSLSKGLSRVFSSITVWRHQFFSNQPFLLSSSHTAHNYWKNHSFDYMNLSWQSDVSASLIHCLDLSLLFFQGASFNFMAEVTICSDFGAAPPK